MTARKVYINYQILILFFLSLGVFLPLLAQTEKSNDLYNLAMDAYGRKNYKEAEKLFRQCWEEDSITMPQTESRRDYSLQWLKHTLYQLGRQEEAFHENTMPEIQPLDRRLTVEIDTLYNEANRYYLEATSSSMLLADLKFASLLREVKKEFGDDNGNLGSLYLSLASISLQYGKADEGYKYAKYGTEILDRLNLQSRSYRLFVPLAEGAKYLLDKKYDKSVASIQQALKYCKGNMTVFPYQYSLALELLENGCYMIQDSTLLISELNAAETDYFNLPEKKRSNCIDIPLALLGLYWNFYHTENMRKLIESGLKSCDLYEEKGNDAWAARARILEYEALVEEYEGNPERALKLVEDELAILSKRPGMTPGEYTTPLSMEVRLLMTVGRHAEAIEKGLQLDNIFASPDSYRVLDLKYNVNMSLAHAYRAQGDSPNALKHYMVVEELMNKLGNISPAETAYVYHCISTAANSSNNPDLFAKYLKKVRETYEHNSLNLIETQYFDSCINLGEIASSKGDKSEPWKTLSFLESVLNEGKNNLSEKETAFPEGYLKIKQAEYCLRENRKDEALFYAENAVEMLERNGEDIPKFFYEVLSNIISDDVKNLNKIMEVSSKMLAASSKDGIKDMEYADALIYNGNVYSGIGQIEQGREYLLEAKDILLNIPNEMQSLRYYNFLLRLCIALNGVMLPEESMKIIEFVESNFNKKYSKNVCEACWKISKLDCLVQLQRKEEAGALLSILKSNKVKHIDDNEDEFTFLCRLGSYAARLGRLTEGAECFEQALTIIPDIEKCDNDQIMAFAPYINLLNTLGDWNRSNELLPIIWQRMEKELADSPIFSTVLLPTLLFTTYQNDGIEATRRVIKEQYEKTAADTGITSAQSALVNMFALEFEKMYGSLSTGYEYCLDYYDSLRANPQKVNNNHSGFLFRFASGALARGDSDRALEALDLIRDSSTSQFDDITQIMLYSAYGNVYNFIKDSEKSYSNYLKAFELSRDYILENFLTMTSEERTTFWNTVFSFYRHEIPSAAERGGYTPRYAALAYDAALFSTGLLLASDINVAEAVMESGNKKIRNAYELYINRRNMYEKATEVSSHIDDTGTSRIAELKADVNAAEKKLLSLLSGKAGNYNRRLVTGWEDVRKSLGSEEAAVEFIELPVDNYRIYLALVIRKEFDAPVMKRLFVNEVNGKDQNSDIFVNCYESDELRDKLWLPLANELTGCKTIWFAPQGRLTVTAIESLPEMSNVTGRPDTRFRRVSSTRELIASDKVKPGVGATIYGDIDFSLDVEGMKKAAGHRALNTREAGGGIDELPGTKEEAEFIQKLLGSVKGFDDRNTRYLNRDNATETSFKMLSGRSPRILHVGTHGYFATEDDDEKTDRYNLLLSGGVSAEDLAMMKSGLLFAGAEGTLFEDRILPDEIDDGVLTAREIASLKLQGTELTVLSACETALGEVGADGVFGLQRGLKKAGADAVMMSLWKVSDEATTALMKSFYTHWLKDGMSKYDALEAAKKDVRTTKGFEHPQYWAPFILIDALD